mmetsp:Transcript_3031/g.6561  ORF Transcript_3031/g.6561 Transcript_3031/m.6561 type:complete len:268 (-) Transcript_3031:56-859(-)
MLLLRLFIFLVPPDLASPKSLPLLLLLFCCCCCCCFRPRWLPSPSSFLDCRRRDVPLLVAAVEPPSRPSSRPAVVRFFSLAAPFRPFLSLDLDLDPDRNLEFDLDLELPTLGLKLRLLRLLLLLLPLLPTEHLRLFFLFVLLVLDTGEAEERASRPRSFFVTPFAGAAAAGASLSPSRRRRLSLPSSLLLSMTVLLFVFPGRRGEYKNLYSTRTLSLDTEGGRGQTQHVWNRQIKLNSIHSPCFSICLPPSSSERVRKPLTREGGSA